MIPADSHLLAALASRLDSRSDDVFCHLRQRGNWSTITWGRLASRSAAFAEGYIRTGAKPGGIILIVLEHGPDLFPAFMGAVLAGCIPSFLPFPSNKQDPRCFWNAHVPLFERTRPAAVVTWRENIESLSTQAATPFPCITPEEFDDEGDFAKLFASARLDSEATAFLQHSSGTTGIKKGVAISHRALCDHLGVLRRTAKIGEGDRIATWLPLYHDMGLVGCFLLPVHAGVMTIALDPFEWVSRPEMILKAIERFRCTHTWWPNFAFHHVVRTHDEERRWDLGSMKAYLNTSEPCKPEAFDQFLRAFAESGVRREQLQISYGMAEVVFLMTMTEIGRAVPSCRVDATRLHEHGVAADPTDGVPAMEVLSCGRPFDGAKYDIVDGAGVALPDDRVGEVVVRARYLFSGYFRNDSETSRKVRDGRYFTGDLAFRRDGELYVIGRMDDRIIACGKNFFAHDIEYVAGRVPGVKGGRAVALGLYSAALGSEEVVVIAESTKAEADWAKLAEDVRLAILGELNLATREVRVVPPGWIVKTTSGKMSRYGNAQKYLGEQEGPGKGGIC